MYKLLYQSCYYLNHYVGVVYITELLMANCTLEALHIGGNDIGDEGIIIIARVLNKTNISKLYVSKCGISLVGAESLATALLDNKNIKLLMVLGNPLTIKGARLILQSAIVNEICQVILVDKEYESDEEIKEMIATLKDRKKHLVHIIASYSYYLAIYSYTHNIYTVYNNDHCIHGWLLCKHCMNYYYYYVPTRRTA